MIAQDWLAPAVTGVLLLITTVLATVLTVRGNRRNTAEGRAPSVKDAWAETERARRLYYAVLAMFWALRTAARAYVNRVTAGGSTTPTSDERAAFDLDPATIEQKDTA